MAFSEQDSAAMSSVGELPSSITSRNDDRERILCWLCSVLCWRFLPPQRRWDDVHASPICLFDAVFNLVAGPLLERLPGGTGGILLAMIKIPS